MRCCVGASHAGLGASETADLQEFSWTAISGLYIEKSEKEELNKLS